MTDGIWAVVWGLLGTVVGSFLNVCIVRLPKGESIVSPGSHCPLCRNPIRPTDNIPILSFLLLRGRCRACGNPISFRYPIVEALSGALCFSLFARYGWSFSFPAYSLLAFALVVVTFIDLDHRIIPNRITLPGIPVGLGSSFLVPDADPMASLLGILIGGGSLMGVALLYRWARKREGMGLGDVKLLAMVGAFLGWKGALFTIFCASATGAAIGLTGLAIQRKGVQTPIPFGPFIALGAILYLFLGGEIIQWYLSLGRRG